jgi:aldo/keto reductase family protein
MKNFEDKSAKRSLDRRSFLGIAGALAAGTIASGAALPAKAEATTRKLMSGRRKLGTLEVSNIGLGVQNMGRKYDTTVPHRPEMINIIRAAYDQGVTFFDTAEAYGPFECERILGVEHHTLPRQGRDHIKVRMEH